MSKDTSNNPFGDGPDEDEDEDDVFVMDDVGDEEDSRFMVPEGDYESIVVDLTKDVSSAGNPMWVFDFQTVEDNAGKKDSPHVGKTFKNFCAITPSAMWKLRETLAALGLVGKDRGAKFNKKDVIGRRAKLTIEDDTYKGKKRSSIATVSPSRAGAGSRVGDKKKAEEPKTEAAKPAATKPAASPKKVVPLKKPASAAPPEPTDDDNPF